MVWVEYLGGAGYTNDYSIWRFHGGRQPERHTCKGSLAASWHQHIYGRDQLLRTGLVV